MTNTMQRTAEIIPFPVRARKAAIRQEDEIARQRIVGEALDSWYHQAAIEESRKVREH